MRTKLISLLALVSIQVGFSSFAEAKKTVCTATINSSEEATIFKKFLDPRIWNFVELVPNGISMPRSGWLADSCKPEVQCDILVISGHFGGTFFGNTGYALPMSELEARSCDSACDGITKKPKEVFLFGCNTLASKEGDSRTPQEYYNRLRGEGYNHAEASQVTALRYSPFGSSFHDQMTQVFDHSPRIYGFSSIGPSGKNVKPLLENYFSSTRTEYQDFDRSVLASGTKKNQKLFTALRITALDQAIGFNVGKQVKIERPYCVLTSDRKSRLEKLTYILQLFQQKKALDFMAHISNTIASMTWQSMSNEESSVLKALQEQAKSNPDLRELLNSNKDILLKVRADILAFYRDLRVMTDESYHSALAKLIRLDQPVTESRAILFCDLGLQMNLKNSDIPAGRWSEESFYYALNCLKPSDLSTLSEFERHLNPSRSYYFANLIRNSTSNLKSAKGISHEHESFLLRYLLGADSQLQSAASDALAKLEKLNPQTKHDLFKLLEAPTETLRAIAVRNLAKPSEMDETTVNALLEVLRDDPSSDVRATIAESLGKAGVRSPEILAALREASSSKDELVMITAFTALLKLQEEP